MFQQKVVGKTSIKTCTEIDHTIEKINVVTKSLDDLVQTLNLEKLEENLYRGECENCMGRVFGGQVLGQALSAAYNTIEEERYAHSFHTVFEIGNRHPHCLSSSKNKRRRKFYNENS